ncbi:MAG: ribonuclease P protein component [Bacilli bacterium]|nr:ribonuclease P protein component [Bacilli bacterium]
MKVKNRVKKHDEFQKPINEGKFEKSSTLNLYYLKNDLGYARVGISVPTKAGNAVVRNKIKRQIRAVLVKELDMNKGFDYIFIARRSYDITNFNQSASDIVTLLEKVGNK